MPRTFSLPVSVASSTTGFKIARCNYFNSNAVPLKLCFMNSDPLGEDIRLMFKRGDDLRQDMLVLQIVNMMDRLWQSYGLDLNVLTFECKPTGKDSGFVELVKECETLREIQTQVRPYSILTILDYILFLLLGRTGSNGECSCRSSSTMATQTQPH